MHSRNSFQMLERYISLTDKQIWSRWWNQEEIQNLEDKYKERCSRSLAEDAKNYQEAFAFSDQKDLPKFFSQLGRSKGFDFTKTIAAMAYVAGAENTILHDLSLSAGGLSLRHSDEGEIIHPEEEVARALAGLA